jgi:hypothetical protein
MDITIAAQGLAIPLHPGTESTKEAGAGGYTSDIVEYVDFLVT